MASYAYSIQSHTSTNVTPHRTFTIFGVFISYLRAPHREPPNGDRHNSVGIVRIIQLSQLGAKNRRDSFGHVDALLRRHSYHSQQKQHQ
jgi:hypothetical protein